MPRAVRIAAGLLEPGRDIQVSRGRRNRLFLSYSRQQINEHANSPIQRSAPPNPVMGSHSISIDYDTILLTMPEQPAKLLPLPENWSRALAVAAHPDDLEYGAASAIARWTSQGKEVGYLMVTKGEAGIDSMHPDETGRLRMQEEINSARVVRVDSVEFLNYADGVIEYGLLLRRDIARAIRKFKPDVLISGNHELTWSSGKLNMADHRAVGVAVLDAARDADNRWIFPELLAEGYEPWHGVKTIFIASAPKVTHYVDVTDFIDKGIESLKEHRIYIGNLSQSFDPDGFLRWGAAAIGELAGCDYAVGFDIMEL